MRLTAQVLVCAVVTGYFCSQANAFPQYLTAFEAKYPSSTLPARMTASPIGENCGVCHHSPTKSDLGNCYREDIIAALATMTIEQALDSLDGVDSDGDGAPNGMEITAVRSDLPGEVGYSPGRVGPTGTDPCLGAGTPLPTGQLETPPPVPTVSTWGLVVFTLSIMVAASVLMQVRLRKAVAVVVVRR